MTIVAVNENGCSALKRYCAKYKNKRPSFHARILQKALPFFEEVDDVRNPSRLSVTISKVFESQAHIIVPKISRSVINILSKYGGKEGDFEVKFS